MDDLELTPFEERFSSRLRNHAAIDVAPANARLVARDAMRSRHRPSLASWWASLRTPLRLALTVGLVGALLVGGLLLVGRPSRPLLADASASPSAPPSAAPSASADPAALADLEGTWVADVPANMTFATPSGPSRLALEFSANARSATIAQTPGPARPRLSALTEPAGDAIRFEELAPGDPVFVDGIELPGCPSGDAGTYRYQPAAEGLLLTLTSVSDACAARTAVLERTWVRSLAAPNTGGVGVVDTFNPMFSVALPTGSYAIERHSGAITIVQAVPELQFLAFLDPQGFLDPCDVTAGRYPVERGPEPFIDYFRQLDGFTVRSTTAITIDGHPGVQLLVQADLDADCPSGQLAQWQPKSETSNQHWFLRPGGTDSLYLIELDGSTLMFEVLPAPNDSEAEVIESIRFLDGLPTTP